MRKAFILSVLSLISTSVFSQEEDAYEGEPTSIHWGWVVGIESGLMFGSDSPNEAAALQYSSVDENIGFGVSAGLSASFSLSDKLALRPQLMVTILPTSITYNNFNIRAETHEVYPLTCDIPVHLILNNPLETNKIGLIIGPAVEFKIPALETGRPNASNAMLRGDIGIALPKVWGKSQTLIELVYGISVTNILSPTDDVWDNWYGNAGRHRLGFRLNFF